MQRYANLSGTSGVAAFACGDGWISVEFVAKPGSNAARRYRYTNASAGAAAIEAMQACARAGRGLATYISQNAPDHASSGS